MAKFEVGEICLDIPSAGTGPAFLDRYGSIIQITILSVPGISRVTKMRGWNGGGWIRADEYEGLLPDGYSVGIPEECLRKLPPDDHADDIIEDPGLTRLKKLLKHEIESHKKPITTPETET